MPKVGVLIAARTASSRLPKKALLKICGKETIALLIERMKACTTVDTVVLCTTVRGDDDELAQVGSREGVAVFRGEYENVAQRLLSAARQYQLDHFVRVTGDDILRCIDLIDRAVNEHLANNADYTAMASVFYGGDSEVISVDALAAIVERAEVPENTEYLTWYLDGNPIFRTCSIDAGPDFDREYRLSLDTPEDLQVMEAIHREFYREGQPVDVVSALKWLDAHPEITTLNAGVKPVLKREELNCRLRL